MGALEQSALLIISSWSKGYLKEITLVIRLALSALSWFSQCVLTIICKDFITFDSVPVPEINRISYAYNIVDGAHALINPLSEIRVNKHA